MAPTSSKQRGPVSLSSCKGVHQRGRESLCSQASTRGAGNVKHAGLSLQRERCTTRFLPRRLGTEVVNCLVTFALCAWLRPHWIPPRTLILSLFSQLICRRHLYGRHPLYFPESRWGHASSFDVHVAELIITQKLYRIVLCSHMPKINSGADPKSLYQHQPLSHSRC